VRLSITQENLSRALAGVGRVVSGRSTLPVLSNVLLTTDGNRLRLSATNLEIGINYWIGSKIEEQGSLTVPARLFADFVASLPHGNIELEAEAASLTVKTHNYESKINGIPAEEFPTIPQVMSDPSIKLDAAVFRDALAQVVVAASADEARPVLAGVHLYTEDEAFYLVATDSYRLAEKRIDLPAEPETKLSCIVPVKTMQELVRLLGETEGELEIYLDESQAMFRFGEVELTSRLIEGQFPPHYRQLIPEEAKTSFDISTSEFSRITKVASLFARESAGSIKLEIKAEGEVSIVSSDSEVGGNKSSAECEVAGDDGEISLNARYLQDALSVVKSPMVTVAIRDKLSACVISPCVDEGDEDSEDYIHLIMPLRS
jgi:DNA polymerase-3 subunit beta